MRLYESETISYPDSYDYSEERVELSVSSVAVLPIVQGPTSRYLLVAQQKDQVNEPWGFIAGSCSEGDKSGGETGLRELTEETGLNIELGNLKYAGFHFSDPLAHKAALFYYARVDIGLLDLAESLLYPNGTITFSPPNIVDKEEICRLGLIPTTKLFDNNLLTENPYKPKYIAAGLSFLRKYGFTYGSFYIESDPWYK